MEERQSMQKGWEFSAKLIGADAAGQVATTYINDVSTAIDALTNELNKLKSGQSDAVLGGFVAEHWHAGTFNIDAVAAATKNRAYTLQSTDYASPDIATNFGEVYSSKYYKTAEKSAIAQAEFSNELNSAKYIGQNRLIPSDQLEDAIISANRQALRNAEIRPEVTEAYDETSRLLTDRVIDEKGIQSSSLTKDESMKIANDIKNDEFRAEDHNINISNAAKAEYIVTQAIKAGITAATLTAVIQTAPEIYKAIDYLTKTGQLDVSQIKHIGGKAITASAEGFLRGSISATIFINCQKGLYGAALQSLSANSLAVAVTVILETAKNAILAACGHITPMQVTSSFIDIVIGSSGFIIGAKIGGLIGQALGIQLPVVGYLIGSFIGCALSSVYNIGKNKLISFCADTGFTCFGLVEQDYTLPESVLNQIGISTIPISRVEVKRSDIKRNDLLETNNSLSLETIGITMVRRGVIGVNRIGYVI